MRQKLISILERSSKGHYRVIWRLFLQPLRYLEPIVVAFVKRCDIGLSHSVNPHGYLNSLIFQCVGADIDSTRHISLKFGINQHFIMLSIRTKIQAS